VDCTAEGKTLCSKFGVRGYPTVKYGDPDDLKDYRGGRDFDSLKKFADSNLGPQCGPKHLDLCDEEKKAKFEKYMAKTQIELSNDVDAVVAAYEDDLPAMRKVLAHMKKQEKSHDEL